MTIITSRATVIIAAIALAFGFVAGTEYQAYKTRQIASDALTAMQKTLAGITPTTSAEPTGSTITTTATGVDVDGVGSNATATFTLAAGNYTVTWTNDCNDGAFVGFLAGTNGTDLPASLTGASGTTQAHSVAAGDYYWMVTSAPGCKWHVSIA